MTNNEVIAPADRVDPALMTVIKRSVAELQEQHEGKNYISTFDMVWIAKSIEKAGYTKQVTGDKLQGKELPAGVTDRQKVEFIIEKVVWELRKLRQARNGKPFESWAEMERESRKIMNKFAEHLPDDVKASYLVLVMAIFMDCMFKFGKWEDTKSC